MELTTLALESREAAAAAGEVLLFGVFHAGSLLPMRAERADDQTLLVVRSPAHVALPDAELTMAELAVATKDILMLPDRLRGSGLAFSGRCPLAALCAWNGGVWLSPVALPFLAPAADAAAGDAQLRASARAALLLAAELHGVAPAPGDPLAASAALQIGGLAPAVWDFAAGGAQLGAMRRLRPISAIAERGPAPPRDHGRPV